MIEDERVVMVDAPDYKGPERRDRLIIGQCGCHPKHQRILEEHDREIEAIKSAREARRKEIDDKTEKQHADMWNDIKERVPNALFYLFISVFSGLFILGLIAVYTGMHKNALTFQAGITDVKVMQAETQAQLKAALSSTDSQVKDLKDELKDLRKDLKK